MQARNSSELEALVSRFHPHSSRFGVHLSEVSRWRIGGPARAMIEPRSISEAADVLAMMSERPEPILVVGDMSNVLFDSAGFDGVILRIGAALAEVHADGATVSAEAGIGVPQLARVTADMGLSGLEHTVGIPGTLGGLVTMNGGSQRKGVGLSVKRVICLDQAGRRIELNHEECEFGYRSSVLQHSALTVVAVDLQLTPRAPAEIHAEMDAVVESRRSRFPEDLPNCGSTFLSDPRMYDIIGAPGKAIEAAGLKGYSRGGAQISPQHANFVVNTGGATSDDVLAVIFHIRETINRATGFAMECEVRYICPRGHVMAAHAAGTDPCEESERRDDIVDLPGVAAGSPLTRAQP